MFKHLGNKRSKNKEGGGKVSKEVLRRKKLSSDDNKTSINVDEDETASLQVPRKMPSHLRNSRRELEKSPECKKLVHSFVQNTLKKGVIGLRTEFLSHKRINDLPNMTVFIKNAPKNRYKDVGCLDGTRVVLHGGDNDYIHANYVSTPNSDKRFICCQAPLDSTCGDHWRMIVQEKIEVILMLCNLTEKGAKKCAEYFPTTESDVKTFGNYTVRCTSKKKVPFPFKTTAVVNITCIQVEENGATVHTVNHYHWVDWPDRGVPPADQAPIWLLKLVMDTPAPVVVHCSAGIGRTGSVVLIQYCLESIAAQQACEHIDVLLLKLRKQRANSVQTDQQYLYVHQVLLNFFLKEGYLDKSVVPFLESFTKDYQKAVITGT